MYVDDVALVTGGASGLGEGTALPVCVSMSGHLRRLDGAVRFDWR